MAEGCRDHWYGPPWYSKRRWWAYSPAAMERRGRIFRNL